MESSVEPIVIADGLTLHKVIEFVCLCQVWCLIVLILVLLFLLFGILLLWQGRVNTSDVFGLGNSDLVPGKYEGALVLYFCSFFSLYLSTCGSVYTVWCLPKSKLRDFQE